MLEEYPYLIFIEEIFIDDLYRKVKVSDDSNFNFFEIYDEAWNISNDCVLIIEKYLNDNYMKIALIGEIGEISLKLNEKYYFAHIKPKIKINEKRI